ncbi:MAG: cytochrome c3 family protein [Acidobacteriota bacterium]
MLKFIVNFIVIFVSSFIFFNSKVRAEDDTCFTCHGDRDLKRRDGSSLFIDEGNYKKSVHKKTGFSCVTCHVDLENIQDFPHDEKLKKVDCAKCHSDIEEEYKESIHFKTSYGRSKPADCILCHGSHYIFEKSNPQSSIHPLKLPGTCEKCHFNNVETPRGIGFVKKYGESVHGKAISKAGLIVSATCSSCHGAHDIRDVKDPQSMIHRRKVPYTCGKCHEGILSDYLEGVHGKDFVKGIKDVPVCTDCHGEHEILSHLQNKSLVYATKVAENCSKCHDDETLSREFGLPSYRMKTYLGSYHGIASEYGETRVANCASCHDYHNIRPSNDPKSSIYLDNIPSTCGKCHPKAGPNFAKGKIHEWREKKSNIWGFIIKKFYTIFISVLIGSFLIYISVDLIAKYKKNRKRIERF